MLLSSFLPLLILPLLPHALQIKHHPLDSYSSSSSPSLLKPRQEDSNVDVTDTDSTDDMGNEDQTGESYYTNNPDDTNTYSLPGDETGDTSSSGDDMQAASPTGDSDSGYYATQSAIQAAYTEQISSANAAISSDEVIPTFVAAGSAVVTSVDFAATSVSSFLDSEVATTTALGGSAGTSVGKAGATSGVDAAPSTTLAKSTTSQTTSSSPSSSPSAKTTAASAAAMGIKLPAVNLAAVAGLVVGAMIL